MVAPHKEALQMAAPHMAVPHTHTHVAAPRFMAAPRFKDTVAPRKAGPAAMAD